MTTHSKLLGGTALLADFYRRNKDVISCKKAVRFDSKRDDWCHLEKNQDMHDGVYDKLAEAGVVQVLENEVWLDINGNIVENEAEAYGRKTEYLLRHPEKLLFVDEVCENIPQKGDVNNGCQKFMVTTDMRSRSRNSFKDNHLVVIGFTAADGCAVMCAIIIAASKLQYATEDG
jgi:hypothetical protein